MAVDDPQLSVRCEGGLCKVTSVLGLKDLVGVDHIHHTDHDYNNDGEHNRVLGCPLVRTKRAEETGRYAGLLCHVMA